MAFLFGCSQRENVTGERLGQTRGGTGILTMSER